MELWVAFAFGALVGAFAGVLIGQYRAARRGGALAALPSPAPPRPRQATPVEVQHVALDEGSANVLNALNNRLAAIGALADLPHRTARAPDRPRGVMMPPGAVRRAARSCQPFVRHALAPAR